MNGVIGGIGLDILLIEIKGVVEVVGVVVAIGVEGAIGAIVIGVIGAIGIIAIGSLVIVYKTLLFLSLNPKSRHFY